MLILSFFIQFIKVAIVLGLLVTIHEFGHFIVAKRSGINVFKFAIGFGPIIFSWKKDETEYSLRLLPLGGFVQLEGEEEESDSINSFSKKPPYVKIAVLIAGSLVNIIFAYLIYFGISFTTNEFSNNTIEVVVPNSAAASISLHNNDKIISINNKKIYTMEQITDAIGYNTNSIIVYERNGEKFTKNFNPSVKKTGVIGINLEVNNNTNKLNNKVIFIQPGSPADKAGIKAGDIIEKIDGSVITDGTQILDIVGAAINKNLKIDILRKTENIKIEITPDIKSKYMLGVITQTVQKFSLKQAYFSFINTNSWVIEILNGVKQLFTGKAKVEQMMGPIGIVDVITKTSIFVDYIYLIAVISINLGIINLLPIPPLDGGKIVLSLIEGVIKRPINRKFETMIGLFFFGLFILLAIFVGVNDVRRIF